MSEIDKKKEEQTEKVHTLSKDASPLDESFRRHLSLCVSTTIEAEGLFKLFSFVIITPEEFVTKFDELMSFYQANKPRLDDPNTP